MRLFRRRKPWPEPVRGEVATYTKVMPCGVTLSAAPFISVGDPFYELPPFDLGEELAEVADYHERHCPLCHSLVSHPDFDLEWTV